MKVFNCQAFLSQLIFFQAFQNELHKEMRLTIKSHSWCILFLGIPLLAMSSDNKGLLP